MPSYNLAAPEEQVVVTWLVEPLGYLDAESIALLGQTAREALTTDPGLDVTQWVRDNGSQGWNFNGRRNDSVGVELGMVWWIRANDQVNITPPTRPPETDAWIAILDEWDSSIDRGFARAPRGERDQNSGIQMYDSNGSPSGEIRAGAHLAHQQTMTTKVIGVLT